MCVVMLIPCFTEIFPAVLSAAEDDVDLYVTYDGERTNEISLVKTEIAEISAVSANIDVDAYRWQICYDIADNGWAYIYDKMGQTIEISRGLFETIADPEGAAYIRAVAETYFGRVYSAAVRVVLTDAPEPVAPELLPTYNPPKKLAFRSLLTGLAPEVEYVNFTINYLSADNPEHHVYQSYTAKVAADALFAQNVLSPTQIGFAAFYTGAQGVPQLENGESISVTLGNETRSYTYTDGAYVNDDNSEIEESSGWLNAINIAVIDSAAVHSASVIPLSYTPDVDPAEDVVINVYYKAIEVPYSVKYYFQNINDDGYTQNAAISYNGMAKTGTIVDDETLYAPVLNYYGVVEGEDYGFSPLYHYPESVAADGSTVFECYYDRNYYLIKFDMDGGYGVEPIYARYGASFVVTPPTKAGFVFKGWDEIDNYVYDVFITLDGVENKVGTVNLNAEEYLEKGSPSAFVGTYNIGSTVYDDAVFRFVSADGDGLADEPQNLSIAPLNFIGTVESKAINYKALWQTVNTNVTIVYWRENPDDTDFSYWGAYSIQVMSNSHVDGEDYKDNFTRAGISSETQYFTYLYADEDVLVLGDGSTVVNVYYSRNHYTIYFTGLNSPCGLDEHTHTDACYHYLCTSHAHTSECCRYGLEEVDHDESCCGLAAHIHSDDCLIDTCPLTEHTHTAACYTCVGYEHTHTDACCSKPEHVHTAECCTLPVHTHGDGNCNYLTCTQEEHTHGVSCYTVSGTYNRNQITLSTTAATLTNPRSFTNNGVTLYYNGGNNDPIYYKVGNEYYALRQNGNNIQYKNRDNINNLSITFSCTKSEHTHIASCYYCNKLEETHTYSCYPGATSDLTSESWYSERYSNGRPTSNLKNGQVYVYHRNLNNTDYKSIYIEGTWYIYTGNAVSGGTVTPTCSHHKHNAECCVVDEHTHDGTHCSYGCGIEPHTHGDGNCAYTVCGKVNHTHTDDCYNCNNTHTLIPEHTHSDACHYACGKIAHTHTDSCCDLPAHTHSRSCFNFSGRYNNNNVSLGNATSPTWTRKTSVTVNGVTLYYDSQANTNNQYLYVQIGDNYYRLQYSYGYGITFGNRNDLSNLSMTRTCAYENEHTHGDGTCHYTCVGYEHTHVDSCYSCNGTPGDYIPEHTHDGVSCIYNNCHNSEHHKHDENCLFCGFEAEHTHDANCNRVLDCQIPEHQHAANCSTSSTSRYHYGFTAKYGQNIVDLWPIWTDYTAADNDLISGYNNNKFVSYDFEGTSTSFASKRPTMTAEMCDTGDGIRIAEANFSSSATERQVNYYFESFYQTGPATSTHVRYNNSGTWYDLDQGDYTQSFYNTANLSAKSITGMTNSHTDTSGNTSNIYYTRNRWTLDFKNYDNTTIPGMSYTLMFGQPYETDDDVASALQMVPPYPSTLEENAYEFAGWYTTEGRYAGSEYKPGTTMPNGNATLFAKWVPVKHTVRFFETYDKMLEYEASVAAGTPDESLVYVKQSMPSVSYKMDVDHGSVVGALPNPDKLLVTNPNGSTSEYDFNGWFMIVNENKKAFTPLDMPITRDTNVFADWGSHTAQPYAVHYALDEYEIDPNWLALLPAAAAGNENKELSISAYSVNRTYICLNDGTGESPVYRWHRIISDMTRGYAYQGTTRTFAARAGDTYHQLYDAYDIDFNDKYYPTPASHSITMVYEENSLEPINNVFTFRYVYVENVNYVVRYLDAVTGEELHSEKYVTTDKAVVTERFVPITDYVPDAFYKQCILAVVEDENNPGHYVSSLENVITFYYSQNDTSARYSVHFMLQKPDDDAAVLTDDDYNITFSEDGTYNFSDKFEESGSRIDGIADKDAPTEIIPVDFAGFNLVPGKTVFADGADSDDDYSINALDDGVPLVNNTYTIVPNVSGTDLFIFYTREQYKYRVYYLLYETPVTPEDLAGYTTVAADDHDPHYVLADTDGLAPDYLYALYGRDFTATAKDIPGYVCISSPTISKGITPVEANNYIIFFYIPEQYTVQYEIVGGAGGTLSNTIETFDNTTTVSVGSTATADAGYDFVGWFVDEACTIPATYGENTNPDGKGTTYTDDTKSTAASGANGVFVYPEISRLIPNGQTGDDTNIFYAKFTPRTGDLTINRTNSVNEGNGCQTFVYEVRNNDTGDTVYVTITDSDAEDGTDTDSVTIHNLICGDYTVTQISDWSHRFDDDAQTVTLNKPTGTSVTFDDAAAAQKWLNGNGVPAVNRKGADDEE